LRLGVRFYFFRVARGYLGVRILVCRDLRLWSTRWCSPPTIMSIPTCFLLTIGALVAAQVRGQGVPTESPTASPSLSSGPTVGPSGTPGGNPANHPTSMPHTNGSSTPVSALAPDVLTRLEIFLDLRSFGPGKIDGKPVNLSSWRSVVIK